MADFYIDLLDFDIFNGLFLVWPILRLCLSLCLSHMEIRRGLRLI